MLCSLLYVPSVGFAVDTELTQISVEILKNKHAWVYRYLILVWQVYNERKVQNQFPGKYDYHDTHKLPPTKWLLSVDQYYYMYIVYMPWCAGLCINFKIPYIQHVGLFTAKVQNISSDRILSYIQKCKFLSLSPTVLPTKSSMGYDYSGN